MRTNVEIDDEPMETALALSGAWTKREVVERALTTFASLKAQEPLRELRGKLVREDDPERMRDVE